MDSGGKSGGGGGCSRRAFLGRSAAWLAAAPAALRGAEGGAAAAGGAAGSARVAVVSCPSYEAAVVRRALAECVDLLGGLGNRVRGRTVTLKVNLTNTDAAPCAGRPAGETYVTHGATALALTALLLEAGAQRVRVAESANSREPLEATLRGAGWDVRALAALGAVEFENTRNLGRYRQYAELAVPGGGLLFSRFHVNRSYAETDLVVSLAKMKNHSLCGVTLSLKNLFGITPNALYGDDAGSERAIRGRGGLHGVPWGPGGTFPGARPDRVERDPEVRVPRIVVDLCAARPIGLAVVEAISTVAGGEGPWVANTRLRAPRLLVAGFDPVATDAVATRVMGYDDPAAARGTSPFLCSENHLLLAQAAGLGTLEVGRIEVVGRALADVRQRFGQPSRWY